jgi:hypothetical protein
MSLLFFVVTLALSAVPDSVYDNPAPWQQVDVDGELTIDSRLIEGTPFSEYRITAVTDVPVERLCAVVFEWGSKGKDSPGVKLTKVLKDGPDARVVYTQIEQPMISNRDYAMTVTKQPLPEGRCRIRFKVTNDEAPPKPEGFVRIERMWGGWSFEPLPEGKTKLTHFLFADPGGSVPTFLVHGGQKNSAKKSVVMALEKAHAALKAGP